MSDSENTYTVFVKVQKEGEYVPIDHAFENYEAADTFCDQLVAVFDAAGIEGFDVYEKPTSEVEE